MHTKCTHMLTDNLNCVMWERHSATLNADLRPGVPCGINTFLILSFHPRQGGGFAGRRVDRNGREKEVENTRGRENRIRVSKERNACGSHCLLR